MTTITVTTSITRSIFLPVEQFPDHEALQLVGAVMHPLQNATLHVCQAGRCRHLILGTTDMKQALEMREFLDRSGRLEPFLLRISVPTPSDEGDYLCKVHAPALLQRDAEIFGVDAAQAHELALQFVKSMLGDAKVVDKDRKLISW